MTLDDVVARHRLVALDSNAMIYLIEDADLADVVEALLNKIEDGEVRGVVAAVGLAEVLGAPARAGDAALFETYASEIQSIPNLRIMSIDAEAALDAAWLRGQSGVGLIDALHLACARAAHATAFITNDRRIRSLPNLEVIQLSDLTPG